MAPKGPYKLITVNNAPERAKVLIGRVAEALKDEYQIEYVANCSSMCKRERRLGSMVANEAL